MNLDLIRIKKLIHEMSNALNTQKTYKDYQFEMQRLQKKYGHDDVNKQVHFNLTCNIILYLSD